jgi:hypothetical protein
MMRRRLAFAAALILAGCAAPPQATMTDARAALSTAQAPAAQGLPVARGTPPLRGNSAIAADILDLTFALETGRQLPVLSRFEGPVTVRLAGDVPPTAAQDLSRLVSRFRAEAGLDITITDTGPASLTVEFVPRAVLRRAVPTAACFVVPRVSSWDEYRAARRTSAMNWATITVRDRAAIFVPSDTGPQDARDCLHEELAQALGPLNDLYRLPDSVFNDDNFHTVLTGFDMLVLRAIYAPELGSGMTRAEVAARLPGILERLNPAGGTVLPVAADPTPPAWKDAIETAIGLRSTDRGRIAAAERAVTIGMAQGWQDGRMAFAWFVLARVSTPSDIGRSITAYGRARAIYAGIPGAEIHVAHIDMQMAAFALSAGQAAEAAAYADRAIPVVRAAQNMGLLATLLAVKAEATALTGDAAQAERLRAEAARAAAYGFGSAAAVRARLGAVAALAARGQRG